MKKMHYFNINYNCDSNCLFCAANVGLINYKEYTMTAEMVEKQLLKDNVQKEDYVMISGGEPSISPYFWDILDVCKKYNCHIELTTNGHIFSDVNLAKKLSDYYSINVQIPVFGLEKQHDYLTGCNGGFQKTLQALNNFYILVRDNIFSVSVKFLLCKATVEGNKSAYKMLQDKYGDKFYYYLNALLVSEKAKNNSEEILEPYTVTLNRLGDFVEYDNIIVDTIPLCLLSEKKRNMVLARRDFDFEKTYSDARKADEIIQNYLDDKCKICMVEKYCDKFLPSYISYFGDDEINPL